MLFIIAMDVLSRLISEAKERHLLALLARRPIQHRVPLYADDVVLFAAPNEEDLALIKAKLQIFVEASG